MEAEIITIYAILAIAAAVVLLSIFLSRPRRDD